jgi:hypothetical protein
MDAMSELGPAAVQNRAFGVRHASGGEAMLSAPYSALGVPAAAATRLNCRSAQ